MIAAILRAQLLSMRPRSSRNAGLAIIVSVVWYGFWCFAGCWAALFLAHAQAEMLRFALPIGLLAVCFYWQAIPVLSASMGSSLDLRKMLVYPVPHRQLFLVEVLLRLTTGVEMVLILLGAAAGMMLNREVGGIAAAPRIAAAVLVYILFNLFLASGTRSLFERLLARRKIRELVAIALALVWMGPRLVMISGVKPQWLDAAGERVGTFGLPWSAAARAIVPAGEGATMVALSWLSLMVWSVAAWKFGRAQFERSMRYDVLAAQATPLGPVSAQRVRWTERFYRIPSLLWRDPLAAIVEKELRSLARSPRFRMVFVMGISFGVMLWLPMAIGRHSARTSRLAANFLPAVCVYAMTMMGQVTFWNCFGLDRVATAFYFVAPQPFSKVLIGKNIACLFFIYIEAAILTGITTIVRVSFGFGQIVEMLFVVLICSTYLMALGNLSSVRYPRIINPERVSQTGGGSKGQALMMIFYPIVLLPVIVAFVARYAFHSQAAFVAGMVVAATIAGTLYYLTLQSAVEAAGRLRQRIMEELASGDGPVAS